METEILAHKIKEKGNKISLSEVISQYMVRILTPITKHLHGKKKTYVVQHSKLTNEIIKH